MGILAELYALKKALIPWAVSLLAASAYTFAGPTPWQAPVSALLIQKARRDLLPPDVTLVSLSPADGFVSRLWVSLLAAAALTSPILILRLATFLAPALTTSERQVLAAAAIPMLGLFIIGGLFAYSTIIPATISFLYDLTRDIGIGQIVSLPSFVGFVAGIMTVVGILFELPVVMVASSAAGLVLASAWSNYRRHAVASFLIFTAVITPDGTGITMMLLAIPLILLYAMGALLAKRFAVRKEEHYA